MVSATTAHTLSIKHKTVIIKYKKSNASHHKIKTVYFVIRELELLQILINISFCCHHLSDMGDTWSKCLNDFEQ